MTETTCKELAVDIASIKARIDEFDKRYEQRFKAQEKAIEKAEAAQESKNQTLNELRGVVTDQQGAFSRTAVVNLQIEALVTRIGAIELDMRGLKERGVGRHDIVGYIGVLLGLIIAAAAIYFRRGG